jgi:hypothetical protein
LYFVALKLNKKILLIAGNILFAVWIAKCFQVITLNGSKLDYWDLVWITLIFLSLCLNVYLVGLVNNVKMLMRVILTKFMHLVWMLIVLFGVFTIFKLESFIIQLIVALILVWILLFYSNFLKDKFLNISYLGALWLLLLFQTLDSIQQVNSWKIDNLYYLFTIIALAILICKLVTFKDNFMKHILIVIGAYLFIISSVYLYNITDGNIYSLTIYWWILSLVWLHIWIAIKNTYARWIALYILILTLAKISLYDIWASNDFNAIWRIIALLLVWWIMIYISVLYNKSKEINLKKDFNFKW